MITKPYRTPSGERGTGEIQLDALFGKIIIIIAYKGKRPNLYV